MRLFMLFTAALVSLASCTLGNAQTMGDKEERMSKVAPELISLYDEGLVIRSSLRRTKCV